MILRRDDRKGVLKKVFHVDVQRNEYTIELKKGLLKKSHSNVASAFRHWLQKIRKKRLQPVEVAAVL